MDDYVKSVLPGETSPGYDPYEFLKAQAIAARMYAHHQTSDGTVVINNSIEKQLYIPNSEYPRSNQAIADTEGVVVAYQGNIINAMFSADHGEFSPGPDYTRDGGTPYLKGVYDPAVGASPNGHGWGMAQTGAKNWAKGQDNHGNSVPPWDYCRILSHYYTSVEFECRNTTSPTPPDYRFDLLYLNGWDNRESNPVPWQINSQQTVQFIVQNTGDNAWILSDCNRPYDQRSIALGVHWYEYRSTQPYGPLAEFDYGRIRLCQYLDHDLNLRTRIEPGETYPVQEPGYETPPASGILFIPGADRLDVGQLYQLRWDIEFRPPHSTTWSSRLQLDHDNQRWPTQDLLVRIASGTSNPPEDPDIDLDPPHQLAVWSNEDEVNIVWQPGGGNVDHYAYAWEQDGWMESWQTTSGTNVNVTRPEGIHAFHLQAVAADGQASDAVSLDPILIDLTPPTASVTPLPAEITDPTQSDFTLTWSGSDEGGSGLYFDIAYTVRPPGGEPPPDPLGPQIEKTAATYLRLSDLGLRLQEGATYTFWVRGHDGAENVSATGGDVRNWSRTQTVYRPVPMFHIEPAQISRFHIYSDTTPLTETISIENAGGGTLNWTVSAPYTWTQLSRTSGAAPSTLRLTVTHPLTLGTYSYPITFSGPINAYNTPQVLPVNIRAVKEIYESHLPLVFKNATLSARACYKGRTLLEEDFEGGNPFDAGGLWSRRADGEHDLPAIQDLSHLGRVGEQGLAFGGYDEAPYSNQDQEVRVPAPIYAGTKALTVSFDIQMVSRQPYTVVGTYDHFYWSLDDNMDGVFECSEDVCNPLSSATHHQKRWEGRWFSPLIIVDFDQIWAQDGNVELRFWSNVNRDWRTEFYLDKVKVEIAKCQ